MFQAIKDEADLIARLKRGERDDLELKREASKLEGKVDLPELARDLAQFANTWGGALLIGVANSGHIVGVNDPEQVRRSIEQAVSNYFVPSTFMPDVSEFMTEEKHIVVANVKPSVELIAIWHRPKSIEYVYRKDQSKAYLNPDEVQTMIRNQPARAARIALETTLSELSRRGQSGDIQVDLASHVWIFIQSYGWQLAGYKNVRLLQAIDSKGLVALPNDTFVLRIDAGRTPLEVNVPYALVKESWVTHQDRLGLLLSVRVVHLDNYLTFAPLTD